MLDSSQYLQKRGDSFLDLIRSKRLPDVAFRANGERFHNPGFAAFRGYHYDGSAFAGFNRDELSQKLNAVHRRHIDVGQDEIECACLNRRKRFDSIPRFHYIAQFQACLAQGALDNFPHHGGVIHN
jgi:hypothetical protein